MVLLQAVQLAGFGEVPLGGPDAFQRAVFGKHLRGLGDQRPAIFCVHASAADGHATAHAVTEPHIGADAQRCAQAAESVLGFVLHKAGFEHGGIGIGAAKAQAVIGDDAAPGGLRQLFGKIPPQLHATQRIMEQHDGRCGGGLPGGVPAPREKAALAGVHVDILAGNGKHEKSWRKYAAMRHRTALRL